MKKQAPILIISITILFSLLMTSCALPIPPQTSAQGKTTNNKAVNEIPVIETEGTLPDMEKTPTPFATSEETPEDTQTTAVPTKESEPANLELTDELDPPVSPVTLGPDNFPEGYNPLTGQLAENPELLNLPPALVSISNFPASARPQAGLNSSPITFELAIGEGMTRFLAVFYGEFPEQISGQTEGTLPGSQTNDSVSGSGTSGGNTSDSDTSDTDTAGNPDTNQTASTTGATIGPIRSGRLPYEAIRSTYSGFLVMASAWEGVAQTLSQTTSIFGSDDDDINSAMIDVSQLQALAESRSQTFPGSNFSLEGMMFSETPPTGGQTANTAWVFYSNLNQIQWRYDESMSAYIRYDIKTDSSGEFVMSTDRLTGEPINKANVIVLFAEHDYRAPTLIDIDLVNKPPMKALLFRDGEIHEIFWTSKFTTYEQETGLLKPIRFVDAEGNPVAMKPGQTWIHLVSLSSYFVESALSDDPFHPVIEEANTGLWLIRYKGKY